MNDPVQIRSVVARFFNVPESEVNDDFVFPRDRLQGSVGRTTFHAALKRLAGADLPTAMTAINYRELLAPPAAQPSQSTAPAPPQSRDGRQVIAPSGFGQPQNGFGVGIDIESVDQLPAAKDAWSDAFYRDNFTEAEIAYCQRQSDPRMSFCGLWSAKEAAMKCDPQIAALRTIQIEITHDEKRRPGLRILGPLAESVTEEYVLSISHAGQIGVAVCVRKPTGGRLVALKHVTSRVNSLSSSGGEGRGEEAALSPARRPIPGLIWLNLALSLLALALWCITWASRK